MNLEAIAQYIREENPGLIIFINHMPAGMRDGVLLTQNASNLSIDYELPGYHRGGFQLVVRCARYEVGKAMADSLMATLTLVNQEVGNMRVNFLRPKHYPISYPISAGDLIEFSLNFTSSYVLV